MLDECVACEGDVAVDVRTCPHCGKQFPVTEGQRRAQLRMVIAAASLPIGLLGAWTLVQGIDAGPQIEITAIVFGAVLVVAAIAMISAAVIMK